VRRAFEATRTECDPRKPKASPRSRQQQQANDASNERVQLKPEAVRETRESNKRRRLLLTSRPSDGRGLGMDPRPPYAFKMSMFNVFCNSH
jgi:hypothetical protein